VWIASAPAAITIDLGGAYNAVRKVQTVFRSETGLYKYTLEGSADGAKWDVLADRSGNTSKGGTFTDIFSYLGLRHLRLTVISGEPSLGIREIGIYNYLRPDMDNGSDTSGFTTNTTYYNANNNPPAPDGIRGGVMNAESQSTGNNFFGLTKDMGWDTIRLRIWNEPKSEGSNSKTAALGNMPTVNTTCSPETTRTVAKYVKGAGQNLAIDFHYADSWSDPQNQPKPYAWANLPFESADPETNDLVKQTYAFTYDMIKSLIQQGTAPSIVALGNEITNGMMWGSEYELTNPYAHFHDYYRRYIRDNPDAPRGGGIKWIKYEEAEGDVTSAAYLEFLDSVVHLAKLVDAGNRAISKLNEEFSLNIQTEMHFAFNVFEQPTSGKVAMDPDEVFKKVVTLVGGLANNLNSMGGMVDRIGVSYYPDWHGTFDQVQRNVVELSKLLPGVKFNIAECSPKYNGSVANWMDNPNYPVGYAFNIQTQGDDTIRIMETINDVPNNIGQGVWPWNGQSVYFTGGQPRASFKAFNDAFAKNVLESVVSVVVEPDAQAALPSTVKSLDVATGVVTNVPVAWGPIEDGKAVGVADVTVPATGRGKAMTAVTAVVSNVKPSAELDVRSETLVAGYKAGVLAELSSVPDGSLAALYDGSVKISPDVAVQNGKVYISGVAVEAPESGSISLCVTVDGKLANVADIKVVSPDKLWDPAVTVSGGVTTVKFASDISFSGAATVGGEAAQASASRDSIAISAESGSVIEITGIKYPKLFPDYSFAFTIKN
jgi:arabinogalactan endo-1,4-beta-galactosidase